MIWNNHQSSIENKPSAEQHQLHRCICETPRFACSFGLPTVKRRTRFLSAAAAGDTEERVSGSFRFGDVCKIFWISKIGLLIEYGFGIVGDVLYVFLGHQMTALSFLEVNIIHITAKLHSFIIIYIVCF